MKVFVTGGTGFVGSHLIDALLDAGHEVTALVRTPAKADALFGDRRPAYVRGDLDDTDALRQGLADAEVVYHSAALTAALSEAEFHRVNVEATARLAALAREVAPGLQRFVHVSSLAAAGPTEPGRPLEGHEPTRPVTTYGRSKLAAEEAVRAVDVPWVIVRPPAVYGPRDVELLKAFKLVKLGLAPVFGDGSQELSFIYVEDLARALIAAAGGTTGTIYHATHPETETSRGLVERIGRAVKGSAPMVLPLPSWVARAALTVTGTAARLAGQATLLSPDKAAEFLAPAWTASPARLETDTGWRAEVDLDAGLPRTTAWYRERAWL